MKSLRALTNLDRLEKLEKEKNGVFSYLGIRLDKTRRSLRF